MTKTKHVTAARVEKPKGPTKPVHGTSRGDVPRSKSKLKRADQYDDPKHNYLHYWDGRQYEHEAEVIAIHRLLKGRHFTHAVDIGGGYGRLSTVLGFHADRVTLTEPSRQQLDIAEEYLKDFPQIDRQLMQADSLKFDDGSVDLVAMIRVMHHLPDPSAEFNEIARILKKDGYLLLEVANYANFKNRVRHIIKGKKLPLDPVDIRSEKNKRAEEIAFVNHNPRTIAKQLAHAGLKVERVLSVSNLRSPRLKKIMPLGGMLAIEDLLQTALAKTSFGPSILMLVRKVK